MQRKTILNRIEEQKGFVVSEARMTKAGEIEFALQPRRGSKPICGSCRSRIEPMQKIAKTLRKHEPLLLNWFESQGLSSGVVEGFNNKAKLTMRKAYGFKDVQTISIALYHQLGNLPEPKRTHKFC